MAYITSEDIRVRIPPDLWLQIFDKDNDGVVTDDDPDSDDTVFLNGVIEMAKSVVDTELDEVYPYGLDHGGTEVDARIKGTMVLIVLYEATRYSALGTGDENNPFRKGYDDAIKLLGRIRTSTGLSLRTAAGGEALRTGTLNNNATINGEPSLPYTRVADGRDPSDF